MIVPGDITYENKKLLRGKFTQQGRYPYLNAVRRPRLAQLRLMESVWRRDVTLKSAISARVLWLLSTIGEIQHEDPEIATFHNNNLKQMEDANGKSWKSCLEDMKKTEYWAGSSVSETLFDLKFGSLYLKNFLTYHPSTIAFFPNRQGLLIEGEKSYDQYHNSGVWQLAVGPNMEEKQLSMWKMIMLHNESDFGNYYGYSMLEPSYSWHRLKEALIDMMTDGLSKAGNRMLWISMASYPTSETRIDPSTGDPKTLTSLELIKEQFQATDGLPEYLFLPQQQAADGFKPQVGSESSTDQVTDVFLRAIEWVDAQSIKHIIPSYLISTNQSTSDNPATHERQLEIFCNNIEADRERLISTLIKKVFMPTQKWNFNRESANVPPTFARVYSDRTEDRVATMQMVKGLIESAVLNPANDQDYSKIMQMLRLGVRERDASDLEFIHDMLIAPRQKTPRASDTNVHGSGNAGRPTGSVRKQIDAKSSKTH